MASRGRKSERGTPAPSGGTPVPSTSTPVPPMRPSSPLSPTRHSRLAEKVELQNLNDRLACYIDRVRNLENENSRLTLEITSARESVSREVSNIKSMYEHELSDARKLLDETAREKAKLEIDTKRLWEENDDLKARLEKKTKECTTADNTARLYESRCTELTGKYNTAIADRKKAQDEVKELEKEIARLRKQLEDLRKNLEEETLSRVDLENTIQSLREELTFKDQIHSQEITETRSRRQVEISEIDGRLSQQYEAKLQQSLQELRDQYEGQMRANRDEIELLYENKIKNLQSAASRNSNAASSAIEELRMTRTKIDQLNSRIGELEAANGSLNSRIRDLEKLIEAERNRHAEDMALLEAELSRLRDEMAQQLQEYQDLMDIKVSLDLEIAAYDKLLKGEEHRLNIVPQNSASVSQLSQSFRSGRGTPIRAPSRAGATKRKRVAADESDAASHIPEFYANASAKGDVEIFRVDGTGRYVKLHNKSNKELSIGGWQVVRKVGSNETSFKLHRSVKIDAGAYVTVWSSDSGVTHEPPTNIVMKQQKWFSGDPMTTLLVNADGEEVASHRMASLSVGEDLYHQQVRGTTNSSSSVGGDPQGEEKCRIM